MTAAAFAQKNDSTSYLKPAQFKINALLIGASLSYEQRISRSNTLSLEGAARYGFSYQRSSFAGTDFRYSLSPYIAAEGRHYYHFPQRLAKHKKIMNNSSNFWSLQAGYIFKPISKTDVTYSDGVFIMPSWGIQRSVGKCFSFELALGPAIDYNFSTKSYSGGVSAGLKFGYVIR